MTGYLLACRCAVVLNMPYMCIQTQDGCTLSPLLYGWMTHAPIGLIHKLLERIVQAWEAEGREKVNEHEVSMLEAENEGFRFALPDSEDGYMLRGLRLGVGVHLRNLSVRMQLLVERLAAAGRLKIVFAAGTLASGIHIPCRTCCFITPSVHLTPMLYVQAAGRCGRRGFDTKGTIVFCSMPFLDLQRLILARLPDVRSSFPLTFAVVMWLVQLLDARQGNPPPETLAMIKRLLTCPFYGRDNAVRW